MHGFFVFIQTSSFWDLIHRQYSQESSCIIQAVIINLNAKRHQDQASHLSRCYSWNVKQMGKYRLRAYWLESLHRRGGLEFWKRVTKAYGRGWWPSIGSQVPPMGVSICAWVECWESWDLRLKPSSALSWMYIWQTFWGVQCFCPVQCQQNLNPSFCLTFMQGCRLWKIMVLARIANSSLRDRAYSLHTQWSQLIVV